MQNNTQQVDKITQPSCQSESYKDLRHAILSYRDMFVINTGCGFRGSLLNVIIQITHLDSDSLDYSRCKQSWIWPEKEKVECKRTLLRKTSLPKCTTCSVGSVGVILQHSRCWIRALIQTWVNSELINIILLEMFLYSLVSVWMKENHLSLYVWQGTEDCIH